jgi:hypothetical protein
MSRGMLRGAAGAWLGLIALQAVVSRGGTGVVGGLLSDVDGLVQRVLDPSVPAIPDRAKGGSSTGTDDGDGNYHPTIPGYLGGGTTTAPGAGSSGQAQNPNFHVIDPPPTGQQNPAYGAHPGGIPMAYLIPAPATVSV